MQLHDDPETVRFKGRKKRTIVVEYRTCPEELARIRATPEPRSYINTWLESLADWGKYRAYPSSRAALQAVERLSRRRPQWFEYRIKPEEE